MGKLVDVSSGGIGIETFAALRRGAECRLEATLHGPDYGLNVRGKVKIVHSRRQSTGKYRIGVQFVEIAYARTAAAGAA